MKCTNCGCKIPDDSAFCENCGAPLGSEKTVVIEESAENRYETMSFRHHAAPAPGGRPAQAPSAPGMGAYPPAAGMPRPGYAAPAAQSGAGYPEPPKKKKTVLIVSIIAVAAVLLLSLGTILFFRLFYVSAAELQAAKDAYLPPAEAYKIDTSLDDPSNDDVKFLFDNKDRITSCTYKVNDKEYHQEYTYSMNDGVVRIDTFYRNHKILTAKFENEDIPATGKPMIKDGYVFGGGGATGNTHTIGIDSTLPIPDATESEPLGDIEDIVVSDEEALNSFLSAYCVNTFWGTDGGDFDCRHAVEKNQNMLSYIVRDPSCMRLTPNNNIYPGGGRSLTPSQVQSCPWDTGGKKAYTFDAETVEWVCRNIFNLSDEDVSAMYDSAYRDKKLWKDGSNYYALERDPGNLGSAYSATVKKTMSDGKYTYITFDVEFLSQTKSYFAVMELKTIEGVDYWSMYYCSGDIPTTFEHFDLNEN